MSQFSIQDQTFDLNKVSRLYPAALVHTGEGEELTQISLEWVDSVKGNEEVKVAKYAIFIHLIDNSVHSFFYPNRELLEEALEELSKEIG